MGQSLRGAEGLRGSGSEGQIANLKMIQLAADSQGGCGAGYYWFPEGLIV